VGHIADNVPDLGINLEARLAGGTRMDGNYSGLGWAHQQHWGGVLLHGSALGLWALCRASAWCGPTSLDDRGLYIGKKRTIFHPSPQMFFLLSCDTQKCSLHAPFLALFLPLSHFFTLLTAISLFSSVFAPFSSCFPLFSLPPFHIFSPK
jgi:hypothetical protein